MNLESPAYPSVDDTRGANLPDVWHSGLTKKELFLAHAVQGALASGKDADAAALAAWEAVESLTELAKPEVRKGATNAKAAVTTPSKSSSKDAYR